MCGLIFTSTYGQISGTGLCCDSKKFNDADFEKPESEVCGSTQCLAILYSYKLSNSLFSLKGSQKSGSKEGDAVTASFFNENGISFKVVNSSSFERMIDENVEFAKQSPLQSLNFLSRMRRSFSCEVTQRH